MLRLLTASICGALCLLISATAIAADTPYSLRVFKLSMSLGDFKQLPFPDQDEWPSAKAACSDERYTADHPYFYTDDDRAIDEDQIAAGMVLCQYSYQSGPSEFSAGLVVAGVNSIVSYTFATDDAGVPRLALISVRSNTRNYDQFKSALTEKYGKPRVTNEAVQNQMGAQFDNEVATWTNSISEIRLTKRAGKVNLMSLEYTHLPLLSSALAKLKANTNAAGTL